MNIVHLIDYFQPEIGYQETFLAREHGKLGHDVIVVTSDRYFPFLDYQSTFHQLLGRRYVGAGKRTEEGIAVWRLPSWEIPNSPLVILRGLKRALNEIHPDIVFCHGVYSFTSYAAARLKHGVGYKLVYDSHAAAFNTPLTDMLAKRAYFILYRMVMAPVIRNAADSIFAVGDDEQKFLKERLKLVADDVPIIRLGVDTERFRSSEKERRRIRKKLGISEKGVVVVCAGKMGKEKDIPVLLEAINQISQKNIRLLLIGGGGDINLTRYNYITHLSYVPNHDLPAYFSASDIGVWPGNFTMTILEAMSCSLPVILPRQSSNRYLEDSNGVQWFARGNAQELLERIRLLAAPTDKRETLGKNARTYTQKELSWSHIAKKTLDLICIDPPSHQ